MARSAILFIATFCMLIVAGCASVPETAQRGAPEFLEDVNVVDENDAYEPDTLQSTFHLLAEEIDVGGDSVQYVGQIRLAKNVETATIGEVMEALQNTALRMGANAFRVEQITCSSDTTTVAADLTIFEVADSLLERNEKHFPKNKVYLFGGLHPDADSTTFGVNDRTVEVAPLSYVTDLSQTDSITTIAAKGLIGETLAVKRWDGRPASYWSKIAFAMSPYASVKAANDGARGLNINTDQLYPVNKNLGRVLVRVLNKQEVR